MTGEIYVEEEDNGSVLSNYPIQDAATQPLAGGKYLNIAGYSTYLLASVSTVSGYTSIAKFSVINRVDSTCTGPGIFFRDGKCYQPASGCHAICDATGGCLISADQYACKSACPSSFPVEAMITCMCTSGNVRNNIKFIHIYLK